MVAEVPGGRIVEAELTPVDHVGQQDRREHFGDRGDAEDGVAVDGAWRFPQPPSRR